MRSSSLLLLSSIAFVTTAIAQSTTTDKQIASSWEENGLCAYYFDDFGKQSPLTESCVKYCEGQNDHGYAQCDVAAWKDIDLHSDPNVKNDEDGDPYVPCPCICENKDAEGLTKALLEIVIEGLTKLDNVICAVMVETFKSIAEVGINFVPGGPQLNAARAFVKGAKTFVENGLEAADYFDNWVGKACGVPDWNFDLFSALSGAPDSVGTSIGCKKKNKTGCKKLDPVPDPPKSKKPDAPAQTPKASPKSDSPKSDAPKSDAPSPSKTPNASASKSSSSAAPSKTPKKTPCKIKNPDKGGISDAFDPLSVFIPIIEGQGDRLGARRALLEERAKSPSKTPGKNPKATKDSGRKSGNPCSKSSAANNKEFELKSDTYDRNGLLPADRASYGYESQNDLCDWKWQDGTSKIQGNDYDSEHVMEWQIVTDFFAKIQAKLGSNFSAPDPAQTGTKVDFCTYWIDSWGRNDDYTLRFSLNGGPDRSPWQHIADAYPSKKAHRDEMVRLQKQINAPAKANLFTDTIPYVWNENDMDKHVNDRTKIDKRDKIIERLRLLIGARTYLLEPKIQKIFKAQKERMGKVIGELDTEMEKHAYQKKNPATGAVTATFGKWEKQGLLKEWNAYMDTKWTDATAKFKKVMDKYIDAVDDAHCEHKPKKNAADKQFCDRLRKVQSYYNSVTTFNKPW